MKQDNFQGIFPYLVSPIDEATGAVREKVLRDLVEHLIASGVHGLSPLGSTGEFAYLSFEQRQEIVRITVEAAKGRVPVLPGVAAFATADGVKQARRYVELGADGLVLILQTMFPVPPSGVESYFRTVAESVSCPIVLYTNPGLLGGELTVEIVEKLSRVPNIQYIKDASSNTGKLLSLINRVGDQMKVFSASSHVPLLVFRIGGVGWMAGPACLLPAASVKLYELTRKGLWDEALELQKPFWRINELFQKYSLAGCVKAGLQIQGFDVGDPIRPQEPLKPEAREEIKQALEDLAGLAP